MEMSRNSPSAGSSSWYRAAGSPELRALFLPYRTLAAELAAPRDSRLAAATRRPLLLLLTIAVFVSFTASGKLVLGHVAWAMLSHAFLVVLQLVGLAAMVALFLRSRWRELPI